MKRVTPVKGALDLVEEATHLLRTAPVGLLAVYYAGTVPFVLGLLYFWSDMSRNPYAEEHSAESALGMAALFVCMKFTQAVFARHVRAQLAAQPSSPLRFKQALRVVTAQTILQSLGLLPIGLFLSSAFALAGHAYLLPLCSGLGILLAALLPFFNTLTAIDDGNGEAVGGIFKKAWRLSWIWPRQNIAMLAVVYFFGLYVFLNWTVFSLTLPRLVKMLFGIESMYTRSVFSMLNTTFFMAMFGLTYLCVDPIFKTLCALRCFYGESVKSGEDLKSELKRFSLSSHAACMALVFMIFLIGSAFTNGSENSIFEKSAQLEGSSSVRSVGQEVDGKAGNISMPDLDHAINQTIHERKYTWRMPRDMAAQAKEIRQGLFARFFEKIADLIRRCARAVARWLDEVLRKLSPHRHASFSGSGTGWMTASQVLLFALIAVVLCALAIFVYRLWSERRPVDIVTSEPVQPLPDIADENVGADQLPEDGWTKLARELLERGEFRLAMRAFYLATLAHLAQRNLISLARFKSNRDYERELRRRGHAFPDLLSIFGENLSMFEGIWYGLHQVNGEIANRFATNVERIKGVG